MEIVNIDPFEITKDKLTGLFDRSTTCTLVNHALQVQSGSVIVLDIADLRRINAWSGYRAGDLLLVKFAQIIRHMFLSTDIIGRIDGDEFFIFLRNNHDEAFLTQRIRQIDEAVSSTVFEYIDTDTVQFSSGFTVYQNDDSFKTMLKRAEKKLVPNRYIKDRRKSLAEQAISADLVRIHSDYAVNGPFSGALFLNNEEFYVICGYMSRMMKRHIRHAFLLMITLISEDGNFPKPDICENIMDILRKSIGKSLRITDVYTRYSACQYLIMSADSDTQCAQLIADRIRDAFFKTDGLPERILISHKAYPMTFIES